MPWAPLEILIDVKKPVKLTKFDHRTCFPVSAGWKLADCLTSSFCCAKHFVWRGSREQKIVNWIGLRGEYSLCVGEKGFGGWNLNGELVRIAQDRFASEDEQSLRSKRSRWNNTFHSTALCSRWLISIVGNFLISNPGEAHPTQNHWILEQKSSQLKTEPNTFHFNDVRGQIAENRRIEL